MPSDPVYDVFLSHSSKDKPVVEALATKLIGAGLKPFLDRWHLIPGEPWQDALEKALEQSATCAVFLGPTGIGGWQHEEMRAALDRRVSHPGFRVIPVLLAGSEMPERKGLPRFLRGLTWVDFRRGLDDRGGLQGLIRGIRGDRSGLFIGREAELRRLRERLEATGIERCQMVLIAGERGLGKSRLLQELGQMARSRGFLVLKGLFADPSNAYPYQGFCELLIDFLNARRDDAEEIDLGDLAAELVALFPMLADLTPLRRAAEPATPAAIDRRKVDAAAIAELFAKVLTRLAAGRRLVVLLENVQGEEAIRTLRALFYRLTVPIFIVGTYDPSQVDQKDQLVSVRAGLLGDARFNHIDLGGLDRPAFTRLLQDLIGQGELDLELVHRLHEATEGNPLFAQHLVQLLIDKGGIRQDANGVWVLTGQAGVEAIDALPPNMQQAVAQRISRLGAPAQRILAAAAVLGKSFTGRDLELLLPEAADLWRHIDALVERGILSWEHQQVDRLGFASGVVRDFVYQQIPRAEKQALHRAMVRSLEEQYTDRCEQILPRLLEHCSQGGELDKALGYARRLAGQALKTSSPRTAIRAIEKVRRFIEPEPTGGRWLECGELQELLAHALRADGKPESAILAGEKATEAFRLAGELGRAAQAAMLTAEAAIQDFHIDSARSWLQKGQQLAESGQRRDILSQIFNKAAQLARLQGRELEARKFHEEAARLVPPEPSAQSVEPVPIGGTLTTALPNAVTNLDPARSETAEKAEVTACVFETLVSREHKGQLTSTLCAGWESSSDGRCFVLTLNREARFSDGRPLTAKDVVASLMRAARTGEDSPAAAFAVIEGMEAYLTGQAATVRGLQCRSGGPDEPERIAFQLIEPLPLFPVFLTDPRTSVVRELVEGTVLRLLGTGPFCVADTEGELIVLARNPSYRGASPPLDRIVFQMPRSAAEIAAGLHSGELDLGRDLLPEDLEEFLAERKVQLVDTVGKNTYFVLFNHQRGPGKQQLAWLSRVLARVVRAHEVVWRALGGHFAQPAMGLIPPGMLGHDAQRRPSLLNPQAARDLLSTEFGGDRIQLKAAVHPLLQDRYAAAKDALFEQWSEVGVEVVNVTPNLAAFARCVADPSGVDLLLGRWTADFDDPDSFTYALFHSARGLFRRYFSSPATDVLLEEARRQNDPKRRQELYREFEDQLIGGVVVPLFHAKDYRLAKAGVHGLRMLTMPPYVDYARIYKSEQPLARSRIRLTEGKRLHVPVSSRLDTLDPAELGVREGVEVSSTVFETLTRVGADDASIRPWLASFKPLGDRRTYHFVLRDDVRFHGGQRLRAQDVRYTFERVLKKPQRTLHFLLLSIRGAEELRAGKADRLAGFVIRSDREFLVELNRPVTIFPAFLTHPCLGIVREECRDFTTSWRGGCVGSGPFRVLRFVAGERLELESNPDYWRQGFPKSDHLAFHFGVSPEKMMAGFRAGDFALVSDLMPSDAESLRRDSGLGAMFHAAGVPRMSTYFVALNAQRPPFSDPQLRLAFARCVASDPELITAAGPLTVPAQGLIPPLLLDGSLRLSSSRPGPESFERLRGLRLKISVLPAYLGPYAAFWQRFCQRLVALGMILEEIHGEGSELARRARAGAVDVALHRWIADYPDADSFAVGLLHSQVGVLRGMIHPADGVATAFSSQLDLWIEEARRAADSSLRSTDYRNIEDTVIRENLLVPLFHERAYRLAQPTVHGLRIDALSLDEVRYDELYLKR